MRSVWSSRKAFSAALTYFVTIGFLLSIGSAARAESNSEMVQQKYNHLVVLTVPLIIDDQCNMLTSFERRAIIFEREQLLPYFWEMGLDGHAVANSSLGDAGKFVEGKDCRSMGNEFNFLKETAVQIAGSSLVRAGSEPQAICAGIAADITDLKSITELKAAREVYLEKARNTSGWIEPDSLLKEAVPDEDRHCVVVRAFNELVQLNRDGGSRTSILQSGLSWKLHSVRGGTIRDGANWKVASIYSEGLRSNKPMAPRLTVGFLEDGRFAVQLQAQSDMRLPDINSIQVRVDYKSEGLTRTLTKRDMAWELTDQRVVFSDPEKIDVTFLKNINPEADSLTFCIYDSAYADSDNTNGQMCWHGGFPWWISARELTSAYDYAFAPPMNY